MGQTVAFDLDGTLISSDSGEDWLEFLIEKDIATAEQARAECLMHMQNYSSGTMDIKAYMSSWCKATYGMTEADCEPLLQEFVRDKVKPFIFSKGKVLLEKLSTQGADILLVSASPDFLVKAIAKELGISAAIGIKVVIDNGVISNTTVEPYSFKEGKVIAVNNWLAGLPGDSNKKLDLAYSDSINDLPLLTMAKNSVCINPDEKLANVAKEKEWQVLSW